jgi:hypothetical protein
MLALIVGTLLAVGALAFVLYPIFFGVPRRVGAGPRPAPQTPRDTAITALREIEFDRATGKLSDADYGELKARYTREAIAAMRRDGAEQTPSLGTSAVALPVEDEIEAAVRAYRSTQTVCITCGPRPEPDAVFCSTCGRYLHDRCADCGAPVEALDARYCVTCGNRLAA